MTTCDQCASLSCRECFPTPPSQDSLCTACDRMECADCGVCGCASACVSCGGPLSTARYAHAGGACWCSCLCSALVMEREAVGVDD